MTSGSCGQRVRVLLNLTGLRTAGGRSVAINLLRAWGALRPSFELSVVGPDDVGYQSELPEQALWIPLKGWRSRGWARPWVDMGVLPKIIRVKEPSVVLTLSNMACRVPKSVDTRQALQIMWPYMMYEDAEIWSRIPVCRRFGKHLRRWYIHWSVRWANLLIAQTQTARIRLLARLPFQDAEVIPTAISLSDLGSVSNAPPQNVQGPIWICLSRYYPHKNLEVLVDTARVLKDEGRSSIILLTIQSGQGREAAKLLRSIKKRELTSHIRSIGEVSPNSVPGLYRRAFGVVLPTLLESYSQVFVESLGYGLPLVTSDRDFSRSLCGKAPIYVDPQDPVAIARAIMSLEDDRELRDRCIRAGLEWVGHQPTWYDTGRMYADVCATLSGVEIPTP